MLESFLQKSIFDGDIWMKLSSFKGALVPSQLFLQVLFAHFRGMTHSQSYSEIEWPSGYSRDKRRASSDLPANINGIHSSKWVQRFTA